MRKTDKKALRQHYTVCQANPLITGFYRMSLLAKKLFVCAIAQINPDDSEFRFYRIAIDDFRELAGIDSKADYFKILYLAASELQGTNITIARPDGRGHLIIPLSSTIVEDQDTKTIGVKFPTELKPYLLDLKEKGNFSVYQLGNIMKMRSFYTIRIYEVLSQFRNADIKKRKFDVAEFRKMIGVPEGKLQMYSALKKKVLEPAKKELPKRSDIEFEYYELKKGRKVFWLLFEIINTDAPVTADVLGMPEIPVDTFALIPAKHRTNRSFLDFLSKWVDTKGTMYVYRNVLYASGMSPKNFVAYTKKSVEENYAGDTPLAKFPKKKSPPKKPAKKSLRVGQRFSYDGGEYRIVVDEKGNLGAFLPNYRGDIGFCQKFVLDGYLKDGTLLLLD